jgi:hypothetical protein
MVLANSNDSQAPRRYSANEGAANIISKIDQQNALNLMGSFAGELK